MYISTIELKNIRCFEKISFNLEHKNNFTMFTTLLGDNSVGKSTLLKCISMGLSDETSAGALMKESSGEMIRKGKKNGYIKINLKNVEGTTTYTITTVIKRAYSSGLEKVEQTIRSTRGIFSWDKIFICGYGVNRSASGVNSHDRYSSLESTYTLFNKYGGLQNSELVFLRQNIRERKQIEKKLIKILGFNSENCSIDFTKKGMIVNTPWGSFLEGEMSDGYQSTINWIIDFFGWHILAGRSLKKIEGILLIDEIENHLHPKWQKDIIKNLKEQLPEVQFIVTSHSPIIAKSSGEFGHKEMTDKLFYLELDNRNRTTQKLLEYLKGMDIDQVLGSQAFGYQFFNSEEDKLLEELSRLSVKAKNRTRIEDKKYLEIKKVAKNFFIINGKSIFEKEFIKEAEEERRKNIQLLEKKLFG